MLPRNKETSAKSAILVCLIGAVVLMSLLLSTVNVRATTSASLYGTVSSYAPTWLNASSDRACVLQLKVTLAGATGGIDSINVTFNNVSGNFDATTDFLPLANSTNSGVMLYYETIYGGFQGTESTVFFDAPGWTTAADKSYYQVNFSSPTGITETGDKYIYVVVKTNTTPYDGAKFNVSINANNIIGNDGTTAPSSTLYGDFTTTIDKILPNDLTGAVVNNYTATSNWTSNPNFFVNWTGNGDVGSGIPGYYYKLDSAPVVYNDGFFTTDQNCTVDITTINNTDGNHSLYLWAVDYAHNKGNNSIVYLRYDTTGPTLNSIVISDTSSGNTTWSDALSVTLALSASDLASGMGTGAKMCFKNEAGGTWSSWEPYGTSKIWTLQSGADGTRTVYFKAKDVAGNENTTGISDTIILDTVAPYPHAPIYINGNSQFTSANGVTNGSGTAADPYIIENWDINASSAHGIYIANTNVSNVYFIIRNCVIHEGKSNYYYGIYFYNAINGKIDNVTSYNNSYGILLSSSSNNNTLTNCNVYNNSYYGIYLDSSSDNTITNCTVYNNSEDGIYLWYSSNDTITNCTISNSLSYDIYLTSSSSATIINTTFNKTKVYFEDALSNLTVKYYLHVKVINSTSSLISGATVRVQDNANGTFDQNYTTGSDGWARWIECIEYWQNQTTKIYYTPHNVSANKTGYVINYASPEPNMNASKEITITLSASAGLTSHAPIYINGNSQFTAANGVASGSGTSADPYILENWDINASSANGIEIRNTNAYFIIRNCTIHDGSTSKYGIYFYSVQNGKIDNITSYYNYFGIRLDYSSNNQITNCAVYNNSNFGIYLLWSSNNQITNCTVYNNSYGIDLYLYCSNNNITNCSVYNNSGGIILSYSSNNNTVSACNIYNNSKNATGFWSSSNTTLINCTITNSGYYDFNLSSGSSVTIINTTFTKTKVYFFDASSTLTVKYYLHVKVINSTSSLISGATIRVRDNANGTFDQNYTTASNGWVKDIECTEYWQNQTTKIYYTPHNVSANKTGYVTNYAAPNMDSSKEITITLSTSGGLTSHVPLYINGNSNFTSANGVTSGSGTQANPYIIENWDINASTAHGIYIKNTNVYFIIKNCAIHDGESNNKYGVYLFSVQNGKIDNVTSYNNYHGITLASSSNNNQITNCAVYNNSEDGIFLYDSSNNNQITNCAVYNNWNGIVLPYSSNNNQITNCAVYNNSWYGIYLGSSSNSIYHNNFINNANQAYDVSVNFWDNNYPSGGNYWSDYTGVDLYSGIGQNISGSDGIGDTPYDISGGSNKDRYPLMSQWSINDTTPPSSCVDTISPYWHNSTFTVTATASDDSSGVKNVTLRYRYGVDNVTWTDWAVFGTDEASPWSWSFTAPDGDGFYAFYSIAADNAGNAETPTGTDAFAGYDSAKPSSSVIPISPYWQTSIPFNISAISTDATSGIAYISLWYRYSTDNSTWNSWTAYAINSTILPWEFTAPNGNGYYQFYSIAIDAASNVEDAPAVADAICGVNISVTYTVDLVIDGNGDNMYGTISDGAGGTSSKTSAGGVTTYYTIVLQNEGNTADTFTVPSAPTSPGAGWTVALYQSDNTTQITSFPWTTPDVSSGGTYNLYLRITAPASPADGNYSSIVGVRSVGNNTKVDSVTAIATIGMVPPSVTVMVTLLPGSLSSVGANNTGIIGNVVSIKATTTTDVANVSVDLSAFMNATGCSMSSYTNMSYAGNGIWYYNFTIYASTSSSVNNQSFSFDVTAYRSGHTGINSTTANIDAVRPTSIINQTMSQWWNNTLFTIYSGCIYINWTHSEGTKPVTFKIYYKVGTAGTWTEWPLLNASATCVNFTSITEGETYYFYVVATDYAGNVETDYNLTTGDISTIVDTSFPSSLSIVINNGDIFTNTAIVNLTISGYDAGSGLGAISLSNDGLTWQSWFDFVSPASNITGNQQYPAIHGDIIVWFSSSNIYAYNLVNKTLWQITSSGDIYGLYPPAMYGDYIVYCNGTAGDYNIYAFNIATGATTAICTDTGDQIFPVIYGTVVVWQGNVSASTSYNIYKYDISNPGAGITKLTTSGKAWTPAIYGNYVVYADSRSGTNDTYRYNLVTSTETAVCTAVGAQQYPAVYSNYIVWQDNRNGNWDIYMYNINTGVITEVCINTASQEYPKIYSDYIVWQDNRHDFNYDIFMYTISTRKERRVTADINVQGYPTVYGSYVVWHDNRYSGTTGYDIYMQQIGNTKTMSYLSWSLTSASGNTTDGTKTVYVKIRDWANNTVVNITDTIIYNTTILYSSVNTISPYWQNTSPLNITATASADAVALYCRYSSDNSTWGDWALFSNDTALPWQWSFNFPNGEGYYQFYSKAWNNTGGWEEVPAVADAVCGYDSTPPLSSINPISPYWQNSTPFNITATASDSLSGVGNVSLWYRYSTDNVSFGNWTFFGVGESSTKAQPPPSYTWSFTAPNGNGHYQFYSIAVDNAGNTESAATADALCGVNVTVDTSAPTTTLTKTPAVPNGENGWYVTEVTIILTATDTESGVSKIEYNIGAGWVVYTVQFNLTEGNYTVQYCATDIAGNVEVTKSEQIKVDTTPPELLDFKINDGAAYTNTEAVTLTVTATDTSGIWKVCFKNELGTWSEWITYTPEPISWSLISGADGLRTIYCRVKDYAGRVSDPVVYNTITLDTTAPTTTDNAPIGWQKPPVIINLTPVDSGSGIGHTYYKKWRMGTAEPTSYTAGTTVILDSDGKWYIKYYSVDNAGNAETAHTMAVWVDGTPPTTTDNAPAGWQNTTPITVTLTATDATSGVAHTYYKKWLSTGTEPAAWTEGTVITLDSEGVWDLWYFSVDVAENTENVTKKQVKIDTTPPLAPALKSPANNSLVNTSNVAFSWYGAYDLNGISQYEIQVDNNIDFSSPEHSATPTSNSTSKTLPDGIYYWRVRAKDAAGNYGSWSAVWKFTVLTQNLPPEIVSYAPAINPAINETEIIKFSVNASDPNNDSLTYQWYVNGVVVQSGANNTFTFNSNYTSSGTWNITVVVSDGVLTAARTWTLTIINVNRAPVIQSYTPALNSTINETESQIFSIVAYDPDGNNITYKWYLNGTLLAETNDSYTFVTTYTSSGAYTITVAVRDNGIPVLCTNLTWTLFVSNVNVLPHVNFTYTPSLPEVNGNIQFTDASYDPDGTIVARYWDFGDGNYSSAKNPVHAYSLSGTYTVRLTVTDSDGGSSTWAKDITVKSLTPNQQPVVTLTYPSDGSTVWGLITITGTASDADGTVQKVDVKIGDGSWQSATGTTAWTYIWDTALYAGANHTISARAYDGTDYSVVSSVSVYVNIMPVANFTYIMGSKILQGAEINITLKVAGKPGAVINLTLKENNISIANLSVIRTSGQPNEASLYFLFNASSIYKLVVERVSGGGGSSVWVIINCTNWNITMNHMVFNQGEGAEGSQTLNLTLILDYTTRAYGIVVFNGTQSKDPDGVIQQYLWSFGDGGSSANVVTYHQYLPGNYTAALTVTDNNNVTNIAYSNITILDVTELYVGYSRQRAARIDCPADLLVTNKTDPSRYVGYKEGILANNITGATAIVIGDIEIYLLPLTGDYTYNVSGTGAGAYTFKVYEPGDFEPGDFGPGDFEPGDFNGTVYTFSVPTTSTTEDVIEISADGSGIIIKSGEDKAYSLVIMSVQKEFVVKNITITGGATHTYNVTDWAGLETSSSAVTLAVDIDSDGISELTANTGTGMSGQEIWVHKTTKIDGRAITLSYQGICVVDIEPAYQPGAVPGDKICLGIFVKITSAGSISNLTITIGYSDFDIPRDTDESALKMYYWDASLNKWVLVEDSGVWVNNNTVWAKPEHLTIFAPMAEKVQEAPPPNWLIYSGIGAIIAITAVSLAAVAKRKRKREPEE